MSALWAVPGGAAFPIPAPAGTPPFVGVLFAIAATVGFVVLVWRVVRYLRDSNDDDS